MLAVPVALPVPETETDTVTLDDEVLAVLDALADWAIASLTLKARPSSRHKYVRTFINALPWYSRSEPLYQHSAHRISKPRARQPVEAPPRTHNLRASRSE